MQGKQIFSKFEERKKYCVTKVIGLTCCNPLVNAEENLNF